MKWQPKTNYYIELTKGKLQEVLNTQLVEIMQYDKSLEWKFEQACFRLKYLKNGNIACGIQLCNASYMTESCVNDYITKQEFDLAKYMYEVDQFLTEEEYINLEPLEIVIN